MERLLRCVRIITIVYTVFLTLLLWLPDPRKLFWDWQPTGSVGGNIHLITFSILGLLVELSRREKSVLFCVTMLVLYTFITEIVQEISPTPRRFDWQDISQDLLGVFFGIAAGLFLKFACRRTFPRRRNEI